VLSKNPGKGSAEEVSALRARIDADQRLLIQWAEEKVQLATAGHELLDAHDMQLLTDVSALQQELAETGRYVEDGYAEDGYDMPAPPSMEQAQPSRRRGGGGQYAAYDLEPPPPPVDARGAGGRRTTVTLSLPRAPSGYASEGYATGSDALGAGWEAQPAARRGGGSGGGGGTREFVAASFFRRA
jgi:hypothetical protein